MFEQLGSLVGYLIKFLRGLFSRKKIHDKYFELTGVSSAALEPVDILRGRGTEERGFRKEYYSRKSVDDQIRKKIDENENFVIVGPPISGKTRTIYEALKSLKNPRNILTPKLIDIDPNDLLIPVPAMFFRGRVIVVDDLEKSIVRSNFIYLLDQIHRKHLKQRNFLIAATCRSGNEIKIVQDALGSRFFDIFGSPIVIPKVNDDEGEEVAKRYGIEFVRERFDGNIGSLFMGLSEMKRRFAVLGDIEKGILRSIKRLYYAGIYKGREEFSFSRVIKVCNIKRQIDLKPDQWETCLELLCKNGFITRDSNVIGGEEAYLYDVIEDHFTIFDNFDDMLDIFSEDPEALLMLGNKAGIQGEVNIEKGRLEKIAIDAYNAALAIWNSKDHPNEYALLQINLGAAYATMSEVLDTVYYCKRAIASFVEALIYRQAEKFPFDHALIQSNIGETFRKISLIQDTSDNCKKAIAAHKRALEFFKPDSFPINYAVTQANLGAAYTDLSVVEEKAVNSRNAINAYEMALKVKDIKRLPNTYANILNNLGSTYHAFAEVEDTANNCRRAIELYKKALAFRTAESLPIEYSMTMTNLGNAYRTLAIAEKKGRNCWKAINMHKKALGVLSNTNIPLDYALVLINLGASYRTLADLENKPEYCKAAISVYEEALCFITFESFPIQYAKIKANVGLAYKTMSSVSEPQANIEKAIEATIDAIKGFEISGLTTEVEKMKKRFDQLVRFRDTVS